MTITAIHVNKISKSFKRGVPVLKAISLTVEKGEFVALIGASGSGKSTLIRIISGLERSDASGGSVHLFDQCVQENGRYSPRQRRLRKNIGVIFQQFNLVNRLNLLTNVLAGRLGRIPAWRGILGLFSREDKIKALQNLERVGIVDQAHQRSSQLSGGQQQRGAIARVLTQEAEVILADEPIASLDPASAERVMEILGDINKQDGSTIIVSLHQIDHALKHCDRIIALKGGVIVFDGPTGEITKDDLSELYGIDLADGEPAQKGSKAAGDEPAIAARAPINGVQNSDAALVAAG